jgi:hypothetical protein
MLQINGLVPRQWVRWIVGVRKALGLDRRGVGSTGGRLGFDKC